MAILPEKIVVGITDTEYRPCLVCDYSKQGDLKVEKGLFHKWTVDYWERGAVALIEMEDGQVKMVSPRLFRFIDTKGIMDQFYWEVEHAQAD